MNARVGREPLSFVDALDAEPERLAAVDLSAGVSGSAYLEHGYAMRSAYADHLERWLARFDRSQVFVYRSEDLYDDPEPWTDRLLDHIGVEPAMLAGTAMPHANVNPGEPLDQAAYDHLVERFAEPDPRLAELDRVVLLPDRQS